MRYLVVNQTTGEVVNAIEWDNFSPWTPPSGCALRGDAGGVADVGDKLNDPKDLTKGVTKKVIPETPDE